MASYIFSDLLSKAPASIKTNAADARTWLSSNMRQVRQSRILQGDRSRLEDHVSIGGMYMFVYDPKTKEKLPYYDKFPLIFPFKDADGGFLGLNLHYLPPVARAKLMDALWPHIDNDDLRQDRKLEITYRILNGSSRYRHFKPCVKRYLNNHVRTRFVRIYPEEWNLAVFLPTERFAKTSKGTVYRDSIGKI
jgi:hypothetical protein